MSNSASIGGDILGLALSVIILICIIVAEIIFHFVFGNGSHFQGGDSNNDPLDILGTVYKGGFVVPIIWGLFFTVVAFVIERWLALKTAFGKESLEKFTDKVRKAMAKDDIDAAYKACDAQKGSVANVVRAALDRGVADQLHAPRRRPHSHQDEEGRDLSCDDEQVFHGAPTGSRTGCR